MKRPSRTLVHLRALPQRARDPGKPRCFSRLVLVAALALPIYLAPFSIGIAADLIGTVLQDGKPVASATVELMRGPGTQPPVKSSRTDESGRYTMTGIVPGPYQLKCKLEKRERTLAIDVGYAVNRRDCSL